MEQDMGKRTIPVKTGHRKIEKSSKSQSELTCLFTKVATAVPLDLEATTSFKELLAYEIRSIVRHMIMVWQIAPGNGFKRTILIEEKGM